MGSTLSMGQKGGREEEVVNCRHYGCATFLEWIFEYTWVSL